MNVTNRDGSVMNPLIPHPLVLAFQTEIHFFFLFMRFLKPHQVATQDKIKLLENYFFLYLREELIKINKIVPF